MPTLQIEKLSIDDLIDLSVTLTVCFGIIVLLFVICALAVTNPDFLIKLIGTFGPKEGAGLLGIFLFFYYILRLVFRRRKKSGN